MADIQVSILIVKNIVAGTYLRPCNFWYFDRFLTFGGLSDIIYCNNLMILSFSEFCRKGFDTGNRVAIEERKNAGENVRPFEKTKK
jgi:hypothetical protein